MTDQLVCNIKFFLYVRFIFGFYHEFPISKPLRWLARCYCCIISSIMLFYYNYLNYNGIFSAKLLYVLCVEYLFYVLISLVKGTEYLLQYYKQSPLIDSTTSNYGSLRVCLMSYICGMFLFRFCGFLKHFFMSRQYSLIQHSFDFIDSVMWFAILIGRSPFLFVFTLLYTRVKMMRQTLESKDFNRRNQGMYHPRRYMQMYETIMDELEKTYDIVKLQLFIFNVFSAVYYLSETLQVLYAYRNCFTIIKLVTRFEFLWFITEILFSCSPLFLSAVLVDLVTMEIQKLLAVTMERLIVCRNERDRAEIKNLLELMRSRPFKFTIWRVVPLNVRSVLSFASFTFTTIIAILQIKQWSI